MNKRIDEKERRRLTSKMAALQVLLEELDAELRKPAPVIHRTRATVLNNDFERKAEDLVAGVRGIVNQLRPAPDPLLPGPFTGD